MCKIFRQEDRLVLYIKSGTRLQRAGTIVLGHIYICGHIFLCGLLWRLVIFNLVDLRRSSAVCFVNMTNLGQIVKMPKWSDLHSMLCRNVSAMSKRVVSLNVANKFCVYFIFDLRVGTEGFRGYYLTK